MNQRLTLKGNRIIGLLAKETRHIVREKHLVFLLLFPPTIQLLLLGAALDPGVRNLGIAVLDQSDSPMSHKLVATLIARERFHVQENPKSIDQLKADLSRSKVKIGIVIPSNFADDLERKRRSNVQVIVDGVDAYTATLASNYIKEDVSSFHGDDQSNASPILSKVRTLYNPDLRSSWYFIPGVMGAMLTLTSTLTASATLLREKELGTLEQLMMTPYRVWEILFAKLAPLFIFLMCDAALAVLMGITVFGVPFRGSMCLFALAASLYILVGMALGIMLATVCKTERQAHLVSFFVNIPVMQLSGSIVPYETMPEFLRQVSTLDPLRYFTEITRSLMLKGTGIEVLWPDMAALALFAAVLISISIARFRSQLS